MNLFDTIFCRRSVRKYEMTPLDESVLRDVESYINSTDSLDGADLSIKIVSGSEVKDSKAPHYILCFCGKATTDFINVGFVMQKADLYLQSKGLGSVWLGIPKPKGKVEESYCIMLGFGATKVPLRTSVEQFDRLPMAEVSNADNTVAQAARLAPSATNSQPWKFNFEDNCVTIDYFGRGILKAFLRHKFSPIDIGIAARHAVIALENEGKTVLSAVPKADGKTFCVEIRWGLQKPSGAV